MAFQAIRLALTLTVAGCALCQERPDPVAYASFFAQVAILKAADHGSPDSANGDGTARAVPKIQDVIDLSVAEVETLAKIAADCVAATGSLQEPRRELIFDSRLEFIETGKHSETLEKKLKDLDERSDELVLNHVRQLKSALSDASFAKMDAYVRTPMSERKSLAGTTVHKPNPAAADKPTAVIVKK
jgi:hypothetical protein